jgi:TPR repeat protein
MEQLQQGCLDDVVECERAVNSGQGSRSYIRDKFHDRLSQWTRAAELGIREAQWLLARCYDEGFGVERSEIYALNWHLKAAQQGYPPAQNHVGSCYQNGDGVPQDQAEAVLWYRKAAEQDYVIAQANLGWCYDTGTGVASDEADAVIWYRKAAEQDDSTSQFNLGVHYEWGSGVEQDKNEAIQWYRKAADQGYEKAAEALERLTAELQSEKQQQQQKIKDTEARFSRQCREELIARNPGIDENDVLKTMAQSLDISSERAKQLYEDQAKEFRTEDKTLQPGDPELKFRIACKNAMANGQVTVDEKSELGNLAQSLNILAIRAKKLFADEKRIFQAGQRVQPTKDVEIQFRKACKKALEDGKVTPAEEVELKNVAKVLKISTQAMKQIFTEEVKIFRDNLKQSVSSNVELQFRKACQKVLADGKVTPEEERQLKSLAVFLKIPSEDLKRIFAQQAQKMHGKTG